MAIENGENSKPRRAIELGSECCAKNAKLILDYFGVEHDRSDTLSGKVILSWDHNPEKTK